MEKSLYSESQDPLVTARQEKLGGSVSLSESRDVNPSTGPVLDNLSISQGISALIRVN